MVLEFRLRPELGEHLNTAPGAPRHLFIALSHPALSHRDRWCPPVDRV